MNKIIHIKQGALLKKVREITNDGNSGWGSKEHDALVSDLIGNLEDQDGNIPDLKIVAPIIKAILCPIEKNQAEAIRIAFQIAGYQLDKSTEGTFGLLSNTVGFADYLAKTADHKTGKPFITKPAKGQKKAAFTALMTESLDTPAIPESTVPEIPAKAETKTGN